MFLSKSKFAFKGYYGHSSDAPPPLSLIRQCPHLRHSRRSRGWMLRRSFADVDRGVYERRQQGGRMGSAQFLLLDIVYAGTTCCR